MCIYVHVKEAAAFGMECQLKEWKAYLVKLKEMLSLEEWEEESIIELVQLENGLNWKGP